MSTGFDWFGILAMLVILGAMFVVPTVVFARDWRKQKADEQLAAELADLDAEAPEPAAGARPASAGRRN